MKAETEKEIEEILARVAYCAIPINWATNNPFPGIGNRKGLRRGPGMDFLGTSLFREGDDERHINQIATASAAEDDEIYKTIYRSRKELKAHIFVDISATMDYGTQRTTKRGLAAELAASIHYALDKTRDKAGCTLFSRLSVHETLPTKSARLNLIPALTNILETERQEAEKLDRSPGDGLEKALSILPAERQLVFVISDFLEMSKADWEALDALAVVHDVVCIFVQDKRERELPEPEGWLSRLGFFYRIEDANGNSKWVWNNASTRKKWTENWKAHVASVSAAIDDCGGQLLAVSTEEDEQAITSVLNLFAGHI